jgi:hypothetical protein
VSESFKLGDYPHLYMMDAMVAAVKENAENNSPVSKDR